MKCPKCQSEYQAGDKFCRECGTKLPSVCPQCGHEVSPKDKFCSECGTDLAKMQNVSQKLTAPSLEDLYTKLQRSMPQSLAEKIQAATDTEGENRILSILFADVTNSVAITENMPPEDSADLISECLKSMTDPILKHGGFINRYLGDSVLAFFGIPETHENDPERAILSALDMRDTVAKLNLSIKISINTGMVYVGAIGPDSHSEFTAMGMTVNLSARLKDAAEPGQILVGETTYRTTRRSFEFQPLLSLTVKGINEPVHAYEVIKPLPKPEKIRGIEGIRSEMIGRDKEFSELKECVDELLDGKGQIVSIIGEAGVGKSRLVSELKGYLDVGTQHAVSLLEGRCVSIGESVGYWVFIDILRSYLEFSEQDSLDDRKKKIIDRMQSLFPQRWEEIVPYIGNLLSIRFDNEWDERIRYLPPEQIKYQTFLTLRDIFLTLAQQNPLLLIFEDLHWADNLSLDMINLLMDILTISPLMMLCYRPEKEHKSWHIGAQASAKCLDRYTEITLKALTQQESRRLVESLLRIENLSETVRDMILLPVEDSWLEIHAMSGNMPRLLQDLGSRGEALRGDFAIETKIKSGDLSSVGGILVRKDENSYIRFDKGMLSRDFFDKGMFSNNEITLAGNIQGEFNYFGRGILVSDIVYFRLERIGDRLSAYCSDDETNWMTCGELSFPVDDPVQIGIHAIGNNGLQDLDIVTRFDYFRVLRP